MEAQPGPLAGIRVIDLTTVFLGPYASLILGDLGADVIKVESPSGDIMRSIGPHRHPGMGPLFLAANRNKRSVVLDLKNERGQAAIRRLAGGADVFLHNMRPSSAAALGVAPEVLRADNPRLIYCAAYGYSEDGPYGGWPAYDDTIQAISGIAALQEPFAGEPQYSGTVVADKTVGLTTTIGVLAALQHRERTGEGQTVDVTMFEAMSAYVLMEHLYGETFVPPLGETCYPRAVASERRPFPTADGWISVVLYTDGHWQRFLELVGREDLTTDPRVTDIGLRTNHIDELYREVAVELKTRSTAAWLSALAQADIPATPVNRPADLLEDEHLREVGLIETVEHPTEGTIRSIPFPVRFSGSPVSTRRLAPGAGQHTREVLGEAGYGAEEIDELVSCGAAHEPAADGATTDGATTDGATTDGATTAPQATVTDATGGTGQRRR